MICIKYVKLYIARVSEHRETHSMDCKNLALCLWPTIIRLDFNSYDHMAKATKLPADIVLTLIERSDFFFHGKDDV